MSGTTTNEVSLSDAMGDVFFYDGNRPAGEYWDALTLSIEYVASGATVIRYDLPRLPDDVMREKMLGYLADARMFFRLMRNAYAREHGYMPALMG